MRVLVNEPVIRRKRSIAQYAFFATLALLVLGIIVTNSTNTSNPLLLWAPMIVLPVSIFATIFSVKMANKWLREPQPPQALEQGLKGLSSRSVVYHYHLPAEHVLVTPNGVFSFTIRGQEGRFHVNGTKWRKEGGMLSKVLLFFRQDQVGNPHRDAERDAERVQALLDKAAPNSGIKVQPIIVLTSPMSELVEVNDSLIPVVHADNKKKPNLKQAMRDYKKNTEAPPLTDDQIAALERAANITPEAAA